MQFSIEADRSRGVVIVTDAKGRREVLPLPAGLAGSALVAAYSAAPSQKVINLAA